MRDLCVNVNPGTLEGGNDDEESQWSYGVSTATTTRRRALLSCTLWQTIPTRHRHNVIMDANLFLDLTGIRHYTTACK